MTVLASTLTTNIAILVLAGFVGFIAISKIPNTLHTPLMSGTNAIHGIVLVAALVLLGLPSVGFVKLDGFSKALLVIAAVFGTINVIGGFLVTDRMLEMFKRKPERAQAARGAEEPERPVAKAPTAAAAAVAAEDGGDAPAGGERS